MIQLMLQHDSAYAYAYIESAYGIIKALIKVLILSA